jgi:ADP-ribose pyrophosphatase YjhB (NUDIX family)
MYHGDSVPVKVIGKQDLNVSYTDRHAVRAILYNSTTEHIALIHIAKGNYYKLPGGGIETDEDHSVAAKREILEETGCEVLIEHTTSFARSEEWRNDLHQISFFYVATLVEDTGRPELTDLESSEGLSHCWIPLDRAISTVRYIQPSSELGKFIQERDLFFIETFISNQGSK